MKKRRGWSDGSTPCNGRICYVEALHAAAIRKQTVVFLTDKEGKGKAVLLQASSDPEGSKKLRFPDFMTTALYSGKIVSLTHRPPLHPGNTLGTHFC